MFHLLFRGKRPYFMSVLLVRRIYAWQHRFICSCPLTSNNPFMWMTLSSAYKNYTSPPFIFPSALVSPTFKQPRFPETQPKETNTPALPILLELKSFDFLRQLAFTRRLLSFSSSTKKTLKSCLGLCLLLL